MKDNLEHELRIFEKVILNAKWKDCKSCVQKLLHPWKNFTYTKLPLVTLAKIYLPENAKKTCKPNNCDINRDWIIHFVNQFNWWQLSKFMTWKVSKYRVFSGPYFPAFGLNTERCIQFECGKIRIKKKLRISTLFTQWLLLQLFFCFCCKICLSRP